MTRILNTLLNTVLDSFFENTPTTDELANDHFAETLKQQRSL